MSQQSRNSDGHFLADCGLDVMRTPMLSSDTVATKSFLRVRDPLVDFSRSFGRMSGLANSDESFSHPPGFSNIDANKISSKGSFNNHSFLNEIQILKRHWILEDR